MMIIGKQEFRLLQKSNKFFYSGLIILIYPKTTEDNHLHFAEICSLVSKDSRIVHVSDSDFYISKMNESISEIIDGPILYGRLL